MFPKIVYCSVSATLILFLAQAKCFKLQAPVKTRLNSPWISPIHLVPKKEGGTRMCIDYRKLNKLTIADPYPLPDISGIVTNLGSPRYITTFDFKSGYFQVPMDPGSISKTAFISPLGKYEYKVMPFRLTGAPTTFQKLMDNIFRDKALINLAIYLDNLVIASRTWGSILRP